MAKKLPKNWLIWLVGLLFVMSVMPGEGEKAANQQAIIATDYTCTEDTDCPTCVGGFTEINGSIAEEDFTFFEEIAYAKCEAGTCRLSEFCIVWDCPAGSTTLNATGGIVPCESVKQTLLDNTIAKLRDNPALFLGLIALIAALFML